MISTTQIQTGSKIAGTGSSNNFFQIRHLMVFIIWQVIAILFVEFALFCAGLGEEEIFKLDPELGSRHMSNKRVTWRTEGFSVSYLNADGMREPGLSVAKPPGVSRIALLGDSLTESLQVPLEKSFGKLIEHKLNERAKNPVQVLNFGTSGYSTAQEYLLLKKQVLKYKPDLVLVCYNNRDSFENWSPADQVITNVRPYALHLPGGKLTIDTSPVAMWMKSPRAKFLKQFEWVRERSRLWGLFAAAEINWSVHNSTYRFVLFFLTRPGKAIKEFTAGAKTALETEKQKLSLWLNSWTVKNQPTIAPSKMRTVFESHPPALAGTSKFVNKNVLAQASHAQDIATTTNKGGITGNKKTIASNPERPIYQQFIMRTLGSLLQEMQKETAQGGGKFAVVAVPVRSTLCPEPGIDTAFNNFDYNDEVEMLKEVCAEKNIALFDCEHPAEALSYQDRKNLFYAVHLTPIGHQFVADQLMDFVKKHITRTK